MFRAFLVLEALAVLALALPVCRAGQNKDADPVYDGKKGSEWVKSLIDDTSARKRTLAIEALAKLWTDKQFEDSLPNITRALRLDSSVAVRAQAAIALGGLKETDIKLVGKDLIDALGTEKESRVRREIAHVMGRHKALAQAGVTNLIPVLKDADAATKIAAAEALALAGSDAKSGAANLAPLLGHEDKAVRRAAVIALGRTSPEGASTIAETMARMLGTEMDLDMKIELVVSLGLLGEKSGVVVEALAKLLTDPEEELRRRAARTLGTFGTGAAQAADVLLKAAAEDRVKDIRVDAVRAFGSALGPGLKGRLKDFLALLKDGEYEVRLAVVEEVGALGNELKDDVETMKVLRSRLSDAHIKVREAAAAAIKKILKKPEPKDPKKDPETKKDPPGR
jgi:HEAT repeat protein